MRGVTGSDAAHRCASREATLAALFAAMPDALDTLERLMRCGDPRVEVRAARFLISFNQKIKEARLAARVEALESLLSCGKRSHRAFTS